MKERGGRWRMLVGASGIGSSGKEREPSEERLQVREETRRGKEARTAGIRLHGEVSRGST